ncbi:universal stress protein [Rhodonellum sp.]|uniref:universal stress protein n=1 Tax=Rhodonellum sp. TaxID=2231180 RepID=UPI00271644DA|nr:universal stress protein [Rhodonellum sp.]MDO9552842.1 universal stress protein [Rhodonellum sp.]
MNKKILVPTDFSDCANAAVTYAFHLAKKTESELIFLHTMITPVNWSKLTKEQELLFPETKSKISEAKEKLKELIKKANEEGLTAKKLLIYSDGKERIEKFVESENANLVVMGSHGQYGFREHILGTNTYGMIRKAKVPVIIVKESNTKLNLDTLVISTNFKEESGPSFSDLERLAEFLKLKLKILFVNTPTYFMETNDILKIGESFLSTFSSYQHDIHIQDAFKEERGIIQFAEKVNADAIAIITHGRSDLMQYFSPSITENLITMIDLPIISIKIQNK